MDIKTQIIISLTSYKIISLLVGTLFAYMGYRLFINGIWGNAGELDAGYDDTKIILKKAAPGTFFALFGALIISVTLYKGLEFNDYSSKTDGAIEPTIVIPEVKNTAAPLLSMAGINDKLYKDGNKAYENNNHILAVKFLYAYYMLNKEAVDKNQEFKAKLLKRIAISEGIISLMITSSKLLEPNIGDNQVNDKGNGIRFVGKGREIQERLKEIELKEFNASGGKR